MNNYPKSVSLCSIHQYKFLASLFVSLLTTFLIPTFAYTLTIDSKHPLTEDSSRAIGFYSEGSLQGAVQIPEETTGLLKILRPRNRGFSTTTLNKFLLDISIENLRLYPDSERLQIGDLSAPNGGAVTGHASHQNGLDADIAYLRVNRIEQDPQITTGFQESFVTNTGVTENFDSARNEWILRTLIKTQKINRIFVDQKIKEHFCQMYQNDQQSVEFLRHLRPWPNHHHHFHVRLICPQNSPNCISQDPPPLGTGCDMKTTKDEAGP